MPKLNKQAPDSQSALMNNAAKDDCLGQPASASAGSEVYKIGSLLANDPGSAVFYGVKGDGVSYDANNNSITVQAGVDEFQYAVRMANGTYSWATAHIGLGSTELVTNGSFEQTNPALITNSAYSEWTGYSALPGWANMNGTQLEVVNSGYSGINSVAGTHWLDTQDSPAPIDIAQVLKLAQGQTAQMKFVVAAEHVVLPGVDLSTSPNEQLDIKFGGTTIKTLTLDDFKVGGAVDYNHMMTFSANVVGGANNTLEIVSHGASGYVGFAIDSVSAKAFQCCCGSTGAA